MEAKSFCPCEKIALVQKFPPILATGNRDHLEKKQQDKTVINTHRGENASSRWKEKRRKEST